MTESTQRSCVVCGSASALWRDMPIDSKTFRPNTHPHIFACGTCGHRAIQPSPTPAEVAQFYDLEQYYTQGRSHMPDMTPGLADRALTRIAWMADHGTSLLQTCQSLDLPLPSRICEIGCGHAENLLALRGLGHDVVGVDPDPKAIAYAGSRGVVVYPGTGEALPSELAPGSMGMVLMSHSLEHCIDPALTVRNVRDLLAIDGCFVCEVPNAACTHFEWTGVCSEMLDAPRHLNFFTPTSLRTLLEQSGFAVVSIAWDGYTRHHSPSWRATELRIRDELKKATDKLPRPHTWLTSMLLWAKTFAASEEAKYDSVRFVSRRAA